MRLAGGCLRLLLETREQRVESRDGASGYYSELQASVARVNKQKVFLFVLSSSWQATKSIAKRRVSKMS
jgi:hypothetical protein